MSGTVGEGEQTWDMKVSARVQNGSCFPSEAVYQCFHASKHIDEAVKLYMCASQDWADEVNEPNTEMQTDGLISVFRKRQGKRYLTMLQIQRRQTMSHKQTGPHSMSRPCMDPLNVWLVECSNTLPPKNPFPEFPIEGGLQF